MLFKLRVKEINMTLEKSVCYLHPCQQLLNTVHFSNSSLDLKFALDVGNL